MSTFGLPSFSHLGRRIAEDATRRQSARRRERIDLAALVRALRGEGDYAHLAASEESASSKGVAEQIVAAAARARGETPSDQFIPGPAQTAPLAATAAAIIAAGKKARGES